MLIIRTLLAVVLAASASAPAVADDWRLTAVRPTKYGLSLSFINAESIRGAHGQVEFSGATYFSRQTRQMNRVSVRVSADCGSRMFRLQQITSYRNQQPIGEWQSTAAVPAKPPSNVFDQISAACGFSDLGIHVTSPERLVTDYFGRPPRRMRAF